MKTALETFYVVHEGLEAEKEGDETVLRDASNCKSHLKLKTVERRRRRRWRSSNRFRRRGVENGVDGHSGGGGQDGLAKTLGTDGIAGSEYNDIR